MDATISNFFDKNPGSEYAREYEYSHGPRLTAMVNHFGFDKLRDQKIADIGGGLGFLGKRLDPSNDYWVIDGADSSSDQRVSKGHYIKADLDHDNFGTNSLVEYQGFGSWSAGPGTNTFDIAFFLETLEHCGNPYHALVEIKKLVKIGGMIVISIPTETVTHNSPYPSLLWPVSNFQMFLAQLALPVRDFWHYQPASVGWPAYHFVCENRPHSEKVMLFPKHEEKFVDCTILQATNL